MFVIHPHSVVDVITNSSSELFVFNGSNKEVIVDMIKEVYPHYLDEYYELKNIVELSTDELELYLGYTCSPGCWPAYKSQYPVPNGFTFEELYEPERDWQTDEIKKPAWNGEIQYKLKLKITDENREDIINRLSPDKEMYFLFSIEDNPDWDYQMKLENFGERIHLG